MSKSSKKEKKLPKEISQEIIKLVFTNLIIAMLIMLYFIVLNLAFSKMKEARLLGDIKVFSGTFLVLGIVMLEQAYKRKDAYHAIYGLELFTLAAHTLSIMHVINVFKFDFQLYILTSEYIFALYYVFKSTILYTVGKKEYLDQFSDISEIIKDEPQKKEAKKRKQPEVEDVKPKRTTTRRTSSTKTEATRKKASTTKTGTTRKKTTTAKAGTTRKKTTTTKTGTTRKKASTTKTGTTRKKTSTTKTGTTRKKTTTAKAGTTRKKTATTKAGTTRKKATTAKIKKEEEV